MKRYEEEGGQEQIQEHDSNPILGQTLLQAGKLSLAMRCEAKVLYTWWDPFPSSVGWGGQSASLGGEVAYLL